ncbi:hypothetical protein D8771_06790 [Streptomyces albus]|uniref:Uncharacterized protein n=1 Tax=Streptomyces albus TaxID=1888 RepID=A0A8H1LJ26_9ACTN|nr:hypothetical protein D8771_06790 [Streptomyces albus]
MGAPPDGQIRTIRAAANSGEPGHPGPVAGARATGPTGRRAYEHKRGPGRGDRPRPPATARPPARSLVVAGA